MDERLRDDGLMKSVLAAQENEVTESFIYKKLASRIKNSNNARLLTTIADDEERHLLFWEKISGKTVRPDRWKAFKYLYLARLLGLTFSLRLMEQGEQRAQINYTAIAGSIPEAKRIIEEENEHERIIISMIREDKLKYVGSIVLGLNDALVELTGVLAGLTLALQDSNLIALVGIITGISASLSMAASEYLSTKTESGGRLPLTSAVYTGVAYIITVFLLVMPFLVIASPLAALILTLGTAILIIFAFNFYISVVHEISLWKRFGEMVAISLGVAALAFGIGYVVRLLFDIEV